MQYVSGRARAGAPPPRKRCCSAVLDQYTATLLLYACTHRNFSHSHRNVCKKNIGRKSCELMYISSQDAFLRNTSFNQAWIWNKRKNMFGMVGVTRMKSFTLKKSFKGSSTSGSMNSIGCKWVVLGNLDNTPLDIISTNSMQSYKLKIIVLNKS